MIWVGIEINQQVQVMYGLGPADHFFLCLLGVWRLTGHPRNCNVSTSFNGDFSEGAP